jgi:hypothetical protein
MKVRKFLPQSYSATSTKSAFISYIGYLGDENLSRDEKTFIKSLKRLVGHIILCDELIHPSSLSYGRYRLRELQMY